MADGESDDLFPSPIKRSNKAKSGKNKIKIDTPNVIAFSQESNTGKSVILVSDSDSNDVLEKKNTNCMENVDIDLCNLVQSSYVAGDNIKATTILSDALEELLAKRSQFSPIDLAQSIEIISIAKLVPQIASSELLLQKLLPFLTTLNDNSFQMDSCWDISIFSVNYIYTALRDSKIWPSYLIKAFIESKNSTWFTHHQSSEFVVNIITAFGTVLLTNSYCETINKITNSCTIVNADKIQTDLLLYWSNSYWTNSRPRFSDQLDFDLFGTLDTFFNISQLSNQIVDPSIILKDEESINIEICVLITYFGLSYMRHYAVLKLSYWLVLGRNIKILSYFIASFIMNMKLSAFPEDSESLSHLINLKLKPIFHEILVYFIQQHLNEIPQDMTPLFDLIIFQQIMNGNSFPPLFISVIKYCLESQPNLSVNNLAYVWQRSLPYIKTYNPKLKILFHQIIRATDFISHIIPYFNAIFENFDRTSNLPELVQALKEDETLIESIVICLAEELIFTIMAQYAIIAEQRQSLPNFNSLWKSTKYFKLDDDILNLTVSLQATYIDWLNSISSDDKTISSYSSVSMSSYCESIRRILFIQPIDQYVPYPKLTQLDFQNWDFIRCQLFYQSFEKNKESSNNQYILGYLHKILNHSMGTRYIFSSNNSILDIFEPIILSLIQISSFFTNEVDLLLTDLYNFNLMERLWFATSLPDPASVDGATRIIRNDTFWQLMKIYLYLFVLDPELIGEKISGIPTISYLILSLITSNFNDQDLRKICRFNIDENQLLSMDHSVFSKFSQLSLSDTAEFMAINIHTDIREIPSKFRLELQKISEAHRLLFIVCDSHISLLPIFLQRFWELSMNKHISELFITKIYGVITYVVDNYINNLDKLPLLSLSIYLFHKFSVLDLSEITIKVIDYVKADIRSVSIKEDGLIDFIHKNLKHESKISSTLLHMFFYFTLNSFNENISYSTLNEEIEDYEFDDKYIFLLPNILSAILFSISMDVSFDDLCLHLKMLIIIPAQEQSKSVIILNSIWARCNFFKRAFTVNSSILNLIIYLIHSSWTPSVYTPNHMLTILFIFSLISHSNDFKHSAEYNFILDNIKETTLNKYIFECNFLLTHHAMLFSILSSNDTYSQSILLSNIKYSVFPKQHVEQLLEFLSLYGLSTFAIKTLLQTLQNVFHLNDCLFEVVNNNNYTQKVFFIVNSLKYSDLPIEKELINYFCTIFNIDSFSPSSETVDFEISDSANKETCFSHLEDNSKFHKYINELKNIDLTSNNSLHIIQNWNCDSVGLCSQDDLSTPIDIIKAETEYNSTLMLISPERFYKVLTEKNKTKIIKIINKFQTYQIINILSCQELTQLVDFICEWADSSISKLQANKALDFFVSLYKKNSIWKNERFISEDIKYFKKYNPYSPDKKFCSTLLKLLFLELLHVTESISRLYELLDSRKFLWIHIFDTMKGSEIAAIFVRLTADNGKKDSNHLNNQSYLLILTYLYLNMPDQFHQYIYTTNINLDHIYPYCTRIIYTVNDKNYVETFKNCIDSLRNIESNSDHNSNIILFCRLIKEHPLIIFRHVEYILASFKRNIKHLTFSVIAVKSKTDTSKDYDLPLINSLIEPVKTSTINEYLFIFIKVIKIIQSNLPIHSISLHESDKIIQSAQRIINPEGGGNILEYDDICSQKVESFISYLKTITSFSSCQDMIYEPTLSLIDVSSWLLNIASCSSNDYKKYLEQIGEWILLILPKQKCMRRFFESYKNLLYSLPKAPFSMILRSLLQENIVLDKFQKIEDHPYYILAERRFRNFYCII